MIKVKKVGHGCYEIFAGSVKWIVNCHERGFWSAYSDTEPSRVLDPFYTLREVKEYLKTTI